MARLSDVGIDQVGHKVLIYGPPKRAGKTLAAGWVASHFPGRTIWLDLENGFKTLKQLPLEVQAGINLIRIPDSRTNQLAIRALDAITRKGNVTICDVHGRVGTVCVDCSKYPQSKGQLQKIDFNALTHEDLVVVDSATQLSSSALALAMKDEEDIMAKVEWDHWGKQGMLLDLVFVYMQQSRANWIVTSHNIDIAKSDKKSKIVPQAGTRNFSANFAKYFDHVVYMDFIDNKFRKNSDVSKSSATLVGSRTNIDLSEDKFSSGIIHLMREVKGSDGAVQAKATLNQLSTAAAQMAATTEKAEDSETEIEGKAADTKPALSIADKLKQKAAEKAAAKAAGK
jgi:hypothetical protein